MQVKPQDLIAPASRHDTATKAKLRPVTRRRADAGRTADAFSNCPPRLDETRHTCRRPEYFNVHPFIPCVACLSALSSQAGGTKREKPALLTRKIPTKHRGSPRFRQPHPSPAEKNMTTTPQEKIECVLVTSENGFRDYDIKGHPVVHRITVGHGIRKGDAFNVYCTESRKVGGVWQGGLEKSLVTLFERLRSEMPN
ncbi:hypothetical protein ACYSUW_13560 [Pseudomonas frederiksbergensis]